MNDSTKQTDALTTPDARALNSVKHGALSELVPSWEQEAFTAHRKAVRGSVGTGGYLQQQLADRAALALWRLDRVARWEAVELESEQRRFHDRLRSAVMEFPATYGAVTSAPLDARPLRESLKVLGELTGDAQQTFLTEPDAAEQYAQDSDKEAQAWAVLVAGGDPATLPADVLEVVSIELMTALQDEWGLDAGKVARVFLGRKATRQEAQDVANWNYTAEASEVAALVAEAVRVAGVTAWGRWVSEQQFMATRKAVQVRAVAARLPDLLRQEVAQATEPSTKRLEKVARYEAHLERVLYRALRELEAMRLTDPVPAGQPDMQPDTLTALN